jgi:hypothetical protein
MSDVMMNIHTGVTDDIPYTMVYVRFEALPRHKFVTGATLLQLVKHVRTFLITSDIQHGGGSVISTHMCY